MNNAGNSLFTDDASLGLEKSREDSILYVYQVILSNYIYTYHSPVILDSVDIAGNQGDTYGYGDLVVGKKVVKENGLWLFIGEHHYFPLEIYDSNGSIKTAAFVKTLLKDESVSYYENLPFCDSGSEECIVQNTMKHEIKKLMMLENYGTVSSKISLDILQETVDSSSFLDDDRKKQCGRVKSWSRCVKYGYCAWKRLPNKEFCFLDEEYIAPTDLSLEEYNPDFDYQEDRGFEGDFTNTSLFYENIEIAFANTAPAISNDVNEGEKYFLYQPSGGMNNQRKQLANALVICRLLDRTCILPPAASHTNYFENYNKQPGGKLLSQQRILNAYKIKDVAKVAFMRQGDTLVQFVNRNMELFGIKSWRVVNKDYRKYKVVKKWDERAIKNHFGDVHRKFLFFSNHSMWASLEWKGTRYGHRDNKVVLQNVTYNDELKRIARTLSNQLALEDNKLVGFNAVHIRRGDKKSESNFFEVSHSPEWYIERLKPTMALSKTLYIATDEKDRGYFEEFREEGFEIVFWEDLDLELLLPFLSKYPARMFMDILSIIEQLICAYSLNFLGSGYSTLSVYILRIRRHRTEVGFDTSLGSVTGLPVYATKDTSCNPLRPKEHVKPC